MLKYLQSPSLFTMYNLQCTVKMTECENMC